MLGFRMNCVAAATKFGAQTRSGLSVAIPGYSTGSIFGTTEECQRGTACGLAAQRSKPDIFIGRGPAHWRPCARQLASANLESPNRILDMEVSSNKKQDACDNSSGLFLR